MAADIIDDDLCAVCGVRCTTDHLFWQCKTHQINRQPFQDAIAKVLGDQKRHRLATYKRISKDIKKPCFVFCGLCRGDK